MDYEIMHLPEANRFSATVDGYTAVVDYVIRDGELDILHTIVPREIGGRGVAAALVKQAYEYAAQQGLKGRGSCSYAEAWLTRHPEFRG